MIAFIQMLTKWIKILKSSHLFIFCDYFAIRHEFAKKSINGEAMQLLCKLSIYCAKFDIEMQTQEISIMQNSLVDILSHD